MAATINAANISIGLDVKKLQEGSGFARGEISKISSLVRQSVSPVEQYNQQLNLLEKALASGAITSDRFAAAQETIAKKYGVITPLMKAHNDETVKATALAAERAAKEKQLAEEQIAAAKRLAEARAAAERRHDSALRESLALRRSVMTAQEKHNEVTQRYKVMLDQGRISHQTYYRLIAQEESALRKATQATKDHTNAIAKKNATEKSSGGGMSLLGSVTRFAPQLALGMAVKTSLELASSVEQASAAFEVLTGSVSTATTMVGQMKQLDRESPLNFLDIQQAGKTLLGYGASAQSVIPRLKQLGDISMGNGERFKSLSLAFGQVTAAGRLTGQEVLQMVNNGFNPLQEISRNTGQSMIELKAQMEAGGISVKMVEDALTSATSAGGRFFGMSERMSKTGAGAYAKLISDLQQIGVEIGTSIMPAAIELSNTLREILGTAGYLAPLFKTMGRGLGLIFATAGGNLNEYLDKIAQMDLDEKIEAARVKQEAFNATIAGAGTQAQKLLPVYEQIEQTLERQKKIAEEFRVIREAKERAESEPAREKALDAYKQIEEEYKRRFIGEEKFARWKIANSMMGQKMTEGDKVAQQNALEKFDYLERAKQFDKEKKDKEALAKKLNEENVNAAKRYKDVIEQPIEKMQKATFEINRLQQGGFLSSQQADMARMSNIKDFQKTRDNGVSATIAPALKAGSVEAYKFILNRKEDAQAAAERKQMLEIQKKQLIEQEKIAANLQPAKAIR
jgi:tape measure domain-containing protein